MKKNMGAIDKTIRILIAVVIAVLYWQGIISGTIAIVLLAVGGIFLLTSAVSSCPLYSVMRMNTCKVKDNE